ncbi:MAG: heavy-metal-associated domain-containing protein, partial [Synergistales bacterium]|nr:heavy-metal-associated domain-containing protein [Synergistales bacterium]
MKYRLKNLGCRGCAARMEEALGILPGVTGASVDFERSLLTIHGEEVDR